MLSLDDVGGRISSRLNKHEYPSDEIKLLALALLYHAVTLLAKAVTKYVTGKVE